MGFDFQCVARFSGLACLLILLSPVKLLAQQVPSASEIMRKSALAMQPPVSYELVTGDVEQTVQKTKLKSGFEALRIESREPLNRVTLLLGEQAYEVYSAQGVTVDVSFMHNVRPSLVDKIASELQLNDSLQSQAMVSEVMLNGRACYRVDLVISGDVRTQLLRAIPGALADSFPAARRVYVDKSGYETVRVELVNKDEQEIVSQDYRNIRHVSLPDTLLLPPVKMKQLKAESWGDYSNILREISQSRGDSAPLDHQADEIVASSMADINQISQAAQEASKGLVDKAGLAVARSRDGIEIPPRRPRNGLREKQKVGWWIVIGLNVLAFVFITLATIVRVWRIRVLKTSKSTPKEVT